MNKYDYGYVIHPDTTTSFAFETVAEGSEVLEIGSSNGNLTKHLAEEKGCAVDIVEINAEAGEQASRFARTGLTGPAEGDLEGDLWLQKLGDRRYDYIVVLDVLEHLREPETVLLRLKGLLKEDGAIILSVPNMAHNSVLIDMIRDRLHYNELGILDNTHLRFFTQGTLDEMIRICGLCAVDKRAILIPVGSNEIQNSYGDLPAEWAVLLKCRPLAEVFQFIYVLRTHGSEASLSVPPLDTTKRLVKLYYKASEEDFFDETRIRFQYIDAQQQEVAFDLTGTDAAVVRIALLEERCILENLQIRLSLEDGEEIASGYETNGVRIKDGCYCFPAHSPEILLRSPDARAIRSVKVAFNPLLYGQAQLGAIERYAREWWEYLHLLESRTREASHTCDQQRERIQLLENEGNEYRNQIDQQRERIAQLEYEDGERCRWIKELESGIAYRDERVKALEHETEERRQWIEELESGIRNRDGMIRQLQEETARQSALLALVEEGTSAYSPDVPELRQRLTGIFTSRTWRLVCAIRSFRRKLSFKNRS